VEVLSQSYFPGSELIDLKSAKRQLCGQKIKYRMLKRVDCAGLLLVQFVVTEFEWPQIIHSLTDIREFKMSENRFELEGLVRRYFSGVDNQNLNEIFQTLAENCAFSVETHKIHLQGRDKITQMFHRLWGTHKSVRHDHFKFVTDTGRNRIAVQFRVINTLHDGNLVYKSNCNFFGVQDGLFSSVNVYMAGENTLDASDSA
jgi:hypothetical protein